MKVRLKQKSFNDLRTSRQVFDKLEELGRAMIAEASDGGRVKGYSMDVEYQRRNRAAITVVGKGHARNSNLKHNSLMKALDRAADSVEKRSVGTKRRKKREDR